MLRGPDLNKSLFPAGLEFVDSDQPTTFPNKTSTTIAHSRVTEAVKELLLLLQCQIVTEPVNYKIIDRQLLATLLRQAGLDELTRPQTNKYV